MYSVSARSPDAICNSHSRRPARQHSHTPRLQADRKSGPRGACPQRTRASQVEQLIPVLLDDYRKHAPLHVVSVVEVGRGSDWQIREHGALHTTSKQAQSPQLCHLCSDCRLHRIRVFGAESTRRPDSLQRAGASGIDTNFLCGSEVTLKPWMRKHWVTRGATGTE